jgi:hypothetical protein
MKAETVRIKIVLATGLALTAIAVFVALLHSPATVARTNGSQPSAMLVVALSNAQACQAGERLPAGTTAIRLQLVATTGPRVAVQVLEGGRVLTHGTHGTAWYGSTVTIPVGPVSHASRHATVCFQLRELSGQVEVFGAPTSPAVAAKGGGKALPGRVSIAYLRPGRRSWWSLAGGVIQHMGLGRAASGTWIVFPIVALATAAIALGSWILVRELG